MVLQKFLAVYINIQTMCLSLIRPSLYKLRYMSIYTTEYIICYGDSSLRQFVSNLKKRFSLSQHGMCSGTLALIPFS